MMLRTYKGEFVTARTDSNAGGFTLIGESVTKSSARNVELSVTRERLQGLVVNLTAEAGLFPSDMSDVTSQIRKLQLLTHLGVPEAMARELTVTGDEGLVTLELSARRERLTETLVARRSIALEAELSG